MTVQVFSLPQPTSFPHYLVYLYFVFPESFAPCNLIQSSRLYWGLDDDTNIISGISSLPHFTQQKNGQSKADKQKISSVTEEKATRAKVLLENFYTGLFTQYKERRDRHCKLEEALRIENMSDLAKLETLEFWPTRDIYSVGFEILVDHCHPVPGDWRVAKK